MCVFRPSCQVSHQVESEHVVLTCQADARPEEVVMTWARGEEVVEGQGDGMESSITLKLINESAGEKLILQRSTCRHLCQDSTTVM